jgi:hypothetical protein
MTTYQNIKDLLDKSVNTNGADGAPHGRFWHTQSRDEFVNFSFRNIRLISPTFDPSDSGLIKALEGTAPFGKPGNPADRFKRMPSGGLAAMPAADIAIIRNWIAARCPT